MSKRRPNSKRRRKALPALGFAGVSLSMVSGACASASEASANALPTSQSQRHDMFFAEEEISDVTLATFYVFDKENTGASPPDQQLRLAGGGGGGCGCRGGGCTQLGAFGGMACRWAIHPGSVVHPGGCVGRRGFFFRRCFGCACGGCGGCGACWVWDPVWGWTYLVDICSSESKPPAEVSSVASEPIAQIAQAEEKK
jgi:hypothetical protein